MSSEVFLYRFRLSENFAVDPRQWLDEDAQARLTTISSPKRAREFLASRYLLRRVLRDYHGLSSARILSPSDAKPTLVDADPWRFNLSHSKDTVVLALATNVEVGVDVELGEGRRHFMQIAREHFAPEEVQALLAAGDEGARLFTRFWALKEAYLKATGEGLAAKSKAIHFDLASRKILSAPYTGALEFFLDSSENLALCTLGSTGHTLQVYDFDGERRKACAPTFERFVRI
ncbi:MAG TPA: 4'-phosphopantetheinyl transferase superfamily protein [Bdellovibrionota bacterium]|jgi:phosphopantetheinyl transferase|nr:4'-phosphopantetheinyl transferase superfamily protein [Bdellovibrionota bacterium]